MQSSMNMIVSITCFVSSVFLLFHYISLHRSQIFFWSQTGSCINDPECMSTYISGPIKYMDPDFIEAIKDHYIEAPPSEPTTEGINIYEPVWRKLLDWYKVQESLNEIYKYQPPGFFIEVGAVDGDFMSQTLLLEKNLSWTGLLVEPDPRSFALLKEAKRNVWITPICINVANPSSKKYWLRNLDDELPYHFTQLLRARSKLEDEILVGDEERGFIIRVPCSPLTSILMALNRTSIDMLSISTGGDKDETKIIDVIRSKRFYIKTILIHFPTSRLLQDPYPIIPRYLLSMNHSQLLIKFYVRKSDCVLISTEDCVEMKFFDVIKSCHKYICFNHMTVWAPPPNAKFKIN